MTYSLNMSSQNEQWRRFGEARRKEIIDRDISDGNVNFHITPKCPIQRYFLVAERVLAQFQAMCEVESVYNLDDTYVMGHRLENFLGTALPSHPDYQKRSIGRLRLKTEIDHEWICGKMEEIALKIDEEQLNKYILDDFVPEHYDDDSSVSSEEAEACFPAFESKTSIKETSGWVFDPFDLTDQDPPHGTDTDSSSNQDDDTSDLCFPDFNAIDLHSNLEEASHFLGRNPFNKGQVNDERNLGEDEVEQNNVRFALMDDSFAASILHKVAREEVPYESDSEAVDSWAQDGESNVFSGASSGTTMTYDPARIAFREIMNSIPGLNIASTAEPISCYSPSLSHQKSSTDAWARIDFASIRQQEDVYEL